MKLLTHNFLCSKFLKGVTTGYPLKVVAIEVVSKEQEFNADFVKRMLARLDWSALQQGAKSLQIEDFPEECPREAEPDEELLKKIHHALLEVEVMEGHLECPETGRNFKITNGIPNMLVNEDEVA